MRKSPLPTLPPGNARSRPFCPPFTPTSKRKLTPLHSRPERWVLSRTSLLVLSSSPGVWSQGPGSHQWPVSSCKEAWGLRTQASTFAGMLALPPIKQGCATSAWQPEPDKCPLGSLAHSSHQIYSQPLATSVNSWWRHPPLPRPLYTHSATLVHQGTMEIRCVPLYACSPISSTRKSLRQEVWEKLETLRFPGKNPMGWELAGKGAEWAGAATKWPSWEPQEDQPSLQPAGPDRRPTSPGVGERSPPPPLHPSI